MTHLMAGDTIQARVTPEALRGDTNKPCLSVLVHRQPGELARRHVRVLRLLLLLGRFDWSSWYGVEEVPLAVLLDKDGAVRVPGMFDCLVEFAALEEGEDGVDAELDDEGSGFFGLDGEKKAEG